MGLRVANMGEKRTVYWIFMGSHEIKGELGIPRHGREDNLTSSLV